MLLVTCVFLVLIPLTYSNICKTPIFDIHRSFSSCSSDISLTCCLEIRNGKLQACQEDVSWNYYIKRGLEYAHGEKGKVIEMTNDKPSNEDRVKLPSMWKAKETGSISCYCGARDLELRKCC